MKKVCFVTGGRMDYGHIFMVLQSLKKSKLIKMSIVTTGMHLSPEFGLTYKKILEDGFAIDKKVECLLSSDTLWAKIFLSSPVSVFSFSIIFSLILYLLK